MGSQALGDGELAALFLAGGFALNEKLSNGVGCYDNTVMAVELNSTAYDYAQELVRVAGSFTMNEMRATSTSPSAQQENNFIRQHSYREYAKCIWGSMTRKRKAG